MAALAAQNLNAQGMLLKSRSENVGPPVTTLNYDNAETTSLYTLGGGNGDKSILGSEVCDKSNIAD